MIKLTKIRLINWHYFLNTTANIENITFLTGENGTGKSTIIDAMQIVLLGDTTGRNFNKAANERTGRTLRGYLRCETGETPDGQVVVLRPGRFTTYIALQFYDTVKDHEFTLGIVIDSFADGKDDRHFFWLNTGFPSNNFTNKDLIDTNVRALTYREFEEYLSSNYKRGDYQFFETNELYRQFLKKVLGNLSDKYFTLFKKSVSFVPISDISQFITEFVCDVEHKVNIEPMRKNIEQYRLLQVQSNRLRERIEALKRIEEAYSKYTETKKYLGTLTYVSARADFDYAQSTLTADENRLASLQNSLTTISEQIVQVDQQIRDLNKDREGLMAKKVGSAGYSMSSDLSQRKERVEQRIAALKTQEQNILKQVYEYCADFATAAADCRSSLSQINLDEISNDDNFKDKISQFLNLCIEVANQCEEVKANCQADSLDPKCLEPLQKDMDAFRRGVSALLVQIDQTIYTLSSEHQELSQQLKNVGSGQKILPGAYQACLHDFTETLRARHPDAKVKMFGDCIDVNDPQWTAALEACLGQNLLNIFVDPAYYTEAYRIMAEIVQRYNYYHLNVIDSERVMQFVAEHPASPSSCASLIDAASDEARAYADYLLGRIRKCQTFEEARNSSSGLLANCTGYRNFTTWYLRRPQSLLIGTKVDASSALGVRDRFNVVDRAIGRLRFLSQSLSQASNLNVMSAREALNYRDDLLQMKEIPDLEAQVQRLDDQLKEGNLKDVAAIDAQIKAVDEDLADLSQRREQLAVDKGGTLRDIDRLMKETLPQDRAQVENYRTALADYTDEEREAYEQAYEELRSKYNTDQVKEQARSLYSRFVQRQKSTKDVLLSERTRYITTYNLSYDTTQENTNEPFSSELNELSNVLLPEYNKKIEEAHSAAIREFKDDFVYKLRQLIETVHSQIDELNEALVDVRFGRDRYRFTVSPNKDLLEYYNMIMDPLLLTTGDADDMFMSKYKAQMDELFALISDEGDSNEQDRERIRQNIERFTDYTTYLNFDLLVKRGEGPNAVESSLAHSFRRQSGGETQTPFYISILASFAQLYRASSDDNTLRLVIFDEAFSKMDSGRIKEAVNLLRGFGLQGVISTPPAKLGDLAKLVDESLVAMHNDKLRMSYLDLYQDTTRSIGNIKAWNLQAKDSADAASGSAEAQPAAEAPAQSENPEGKTAPQE